MRSMRALVSPALLSFLAASGCPSGSDERPEPPQAPTEEPSEAPPPQTEKVAEPQGPALEEPADPNEACAQIVLVSYKGAKFAPETVTRDKAAAAARVAELVKKARAGADFADLAKTESDAPSSAPRGGMLGAYTKDEWPELHGALRDPLFALKVNEVAEAPVEADYGFVVLRRCRVEKANSRHILVRYRGAERAGPRITRGKESARQRAQELYQKLKDGADFAELAKEASDDSSGLRGGGLGMQSRGRLALEYERALFALKPGELSEPVETEFGFHIIERLPPPEPGAPEPQADAP